MDLMYGCPHTFGHVLSEAIFRIKLIVVVFLSVLLGISLPSGHQPGFQHGYMSFVPIIYKKGSHFHDLEASFWPTQFIQFHMYDILHVRYSSI